MGVNVVIDDALLAEATRVAGLESDSATIEEALRLLIANRRRQALENLRGMGWEGDLEAMREGRADHSGK
ncbi:type II toxin-antitoxin system VapB family antitoxin [Aureimonas leprariae]|uniref:Type II toxin-antitoxin system VapB family antitoxin n=1 Tax=Plantimonas leprariae TaxID=2615207 RepID=A0A7V7PP63_9HYPH|nr:type II toxin-antitoxin system VapB family antitoxin [Aureimonas leprariae]KAB0679699.1 type II toxin-antitoxin system VapB family antitoxin [Aureimonas leprariae]